MAKELLQEQAHAPGRQHGVKRPLVEKLDQAALHHPAEEKGDGERDGDADQKEQIHRTRHEAFEHGGASVGRVSAHRHQLAVRHVDDAHQSEHDRQAERHQQQDGEQRQTVESLQQEGGERHLFTSQSLAPAAC